MGILCAGEVLGKGGGGAGGIQCAARAGGEPQATSAAGWGEGEIRELVGVVDLGRAKPGAARPPGVADDSALWRSRWRHVSGSRRIPHLRRVRSQMSRRQEIDAAHATSLTERTESEIDSGQPQHPLRDRLGRSLGGWRRLVEEGTAARQARPTVAVGEQAEVPDTDEAAGEDVQEEAAEELIGFEGHDLDGVAVGVVLPAQAHDALVEADETVVGKRHAVGVAPEVGQHLLGAGEGRFRIHHPVARPQRAEPGGERWRVHPRGGGTGEAEVSGGEGVP